MRAAGILLPVSSLPGRYGIGTMGQEARQFVDFLKKANQKYWQILPLGPTGFGDSPYQSVSAFAGNPYLIDLSLLEKEGLLQEKDYRHMQQPAGKVDYPLQYKEKMQVLRLAASRFFQKPPKAFAAFCQQETWLFGYAAFMTVRGRMDLKALCDWHESLRDFEAAKQILQEDEAARQEMDFWRFVQYEFFLQWDALKAYANKRGISVIGDVPIYVAADSADLWENPGLFQMDSEGRLSSVAGVPPDYFSPEGQYWGNPLYDWDAHGKEEYAWWKKRMRHAMRLYDVVRIDHFRGFAGYWSVPNGEKATAGHWEKGPGIKLFAALEQELGELPIIAEDLGDITPDVRQLLQDSSFPGMKVLQFAFSSNEDNEYLPHNHVQKCVVYTGTHDNTTLCDWINTEDASSVRYARKYFGLQSKKELPAALIRAALSSVADTVIIPLCDWLEKGAEGRINTPNTTEANWSFQLTEKELTGQLCSAIARKTTRYGRSVPKRKLKKQTV